MHTIHVARFEAALGLRDDIPGPHVAVVDVGRIHDEEAAILPVRDQPLDHLQVNLLAHFPLEPWHFGERDVVRQEVEHAALLDPVRFRVAVELHDRLEGVRRPEKRERRDQGAGTHAGHDVELGRAIGPGGTCPQPCRNPAPNAPQSPPPETMRISITGGVDRRPAL